MVRNAERLDWQVVLENNAWARPETLEELVGKPETKEPQLVLAQRRIWWNSRLVWGLACLLLIIASGGYLLWQQANAGYQLIRNEIRETVELETWLAQRGSQGSRQVMAANLVGNTPPDWQRQLTQEVPIFRGDVPDPQVAVGEVELLDDLAMVQVKLAQAEAGEHPEPFSVYRATRYYRFVDGQWRRTAPNPRFWGALQTMETAYFQFHFRSKDREAVEQAADRMDTIYADLRRDLGLAPPAVDAPKRRVEVLDKISPHYLYYSADDEQVLVLSPLVLAIPDHVSEAEILTKAMIHQLARSVMNEATGEHFDRPQWVMLLDGIQLWQAYEGSHSLPFWYDDAVTWLYQDAPAIRAGKREPQVDDLNLLCRGYDLWGITVPLDLSAPSLCLVDEWSIQLKYVQPAPTRLSSLLYFTEDEHHPNPELGLNNWVQKVAAATVVEYLVAVYGREFIPVLLDSIRLYDSWQEVIPEVTGVTAGEFEAGWQRYIAKRYAGCGDECGEARPMIVP